MNDTKNLSASDEHVFDPLVTHGRFPYRPIVDTDNFRWPGDAGLAVYLGFNIEHFAFGEGLGAALGPVSPEPDVLNYSWREYGNRVGVWRCLELFDQLEMPAGALINTFVPSVDGRVKAIAATNSTVYLGGDFANVNGVARSKLAAVNASDGSSATSSMSSAGEFSTDPR